MTNQELAKQAVEKIDATCPMFPRNESKSAALTIFSHYAPAFALIKQMQDALKDAQWQMKGGTPFDKVVAAIAAANEYLEKSTDASS